MDWGKSSKQERRVGSGSTMITLPLIALTSPMLFGDLVADVKRIEAASSEKLYAAKAVSGEIVGPVRCEFALQKPILFRSKDALTEIVYDGKVHWTHLIQEKLFIKGSLKDRGFLGVPIGLDPFFGAKIPNQLPYIINFTEYLFLKVDGKRAAAIVYHFEDFGRDDKLSLFIDPIGHLPIGWDQVFGGTKSSYRFRNVRINDPVPADTFHWTIPNGVTERISRKR
jgi:hypothetical protein